MIGPGAVFIGGDIYRRTGFGSNHPLAIPRVGLVIELCEALGWLNGAYIQSPMASEQELCRYHDPEYVAAVKRISECGKATIEERTQFNIGNRENPVFENMFVRAATTCGGSILAAKHALEGRVAFNPGGGTHHGLRDRAHGFCYFNDPVFAILTLLDGGAESVIYLDLDAHHGDGVEAAFQDDPRVTTISIHETGKWPGTGTEHGPAGSGMYNFAVPSGFNDDELHLLMDSAVLPLIETTKSDVAVITCGADALAADPLSGMCLTNVGLWNAVTKVTERVTGAVILGGGGYNPWTVARCWAGLWGRLSHRTPPWSVPESIASRFAEIECDLIEEEDWDPAWFERLDDDQAPCPVRKDVHMLVDDFRRT